MSDWIVFGITAVLLVTALLFFTAAVIGVYRFGFVLNRMHAVAMGDSIGLMCVIAAVMISTGLKIDSLKLMLLIVFMWFSSPASSHFLSQVECYTNEHLYRYTLRFSEETDDAEAEDKRDGDREKPVRMSGIET